jgi:hypothetical protein
MPVVEGAESNDDPHRPVFPMGVSRPFDGRAEFPSCIGSREGS